MATYNESIYELNESISSILNQSYSDFEFIIVLDNPANNEIKYFLESEVAKDSRLHIIVNEENIGLARSLNRAISLSEGKYIARMDADDISLPDRFKKQVNFLDNNKEYSIVATDRVDIDENGVELNTNHIVINNTKIMKKIFRYSNIITHPSVMFRRELILDLNGYQHFDAAQDYDLWLRALNRNYKIYILPDILIKYRIREKSISNSNVARQHTCMMYARYLNNKDCLSYSYEGYISFLKKIKLYKNEDIDRYNFAYNMIFNTDYKKRYLKLVHMLKAFFMNYNIVKYFINSKIRDYFIRKYNEKNL